MVDQRNYPKLYRHIQKLEEDPAVIFSHATEEDKPATSAGGFLGHVTLDDIKARSKA